MPHFPAMSRIVVLPKPSVWKSLSETSRIFFFVASFFDSRRPMRAPRSYPGGGRRRDRSGKEEDGQSRDPEPGLGRGKRERQCRDAEHAGEDGSRDRGFGDRRLLAAPRQAHERAEEAQQARGADSPEDNVVSRDLLRRVAGRGEDRGGDERGQEAGAPARDARDEAVHATLQL